MSHSHINFLQEFEIYIVEHSLQNKEIQLTEYNCSKSSSETIDIIDIINVVPVSILLTLNS